MGKHSGRGYQPERFCDPGLCDCCQYIGAGDFICDVCMEVVVSDWELTANYLMCKGEDYESV